MRQKISVIITDLDNTLYDWLTMWYQSFNVFIDRLEQDSHIPKNILIPEIRDIHQKHGTVEYEHLLRDIPSLQEKFKGEDLEKKFESSLILLRDTQKYHLKLYPDTMNTLLYLKRIGVKIIGYTDSKALPTSIRIKELGLDGVLDVVYSQPWIIKKREPLIHTHHNELSPAEGKPSVTGLLRIIQEIGADIEKCAYLGDSLVKDISMAQDSGVLDILVDYGKAHNTPAYELLRTVSYWTPQQIAHEKRILANRSIVPTIELKKSMAEILNHIEAEPFKTPRRTISAGITFNLDR